MCKHVHRHVSTHVHGYAHRHVCRHVCRHHQLGSTTTTMGLSDDINAEVETYLDRLRAGEMDLADVLGYVDAAVNEGNFSRVRPQQPAIYLVRDN